MPLKGCMHIIGHTNEKQAAKAEEPKPAPAAVELAKSENQVETYGTTPQPPAPAATNAVTSTPLPAPAPVKEEEDDLSVKIEPGTLCRRNGCKAEFVSDEVSREPTGEGSTCVYHPSPVRHVLPPFISLHLRVFSQFSGKEVRYAPLRLVRSLLPTRFPGIPLLQATRTRIR